MSLKEFVSSEDGNCECWNVFVTKQKSKVCFTLRLPLDVTSWILIVLYLGGFFSVSVSAVLVNYLCSLRRKFMVLKFFSSLYYSLIVLELRV